MDFSADWSLFCREPTTKEVGFYQVGSVSFNTIPIRTCITGNMRSSLQYGVMETPVTQELYEAVMGVNPSFFKDRPKNPVECVNWADAQSFCAKLSTLTGSTFRLPTSREWNLALGGKTTLASFSPIEDYAILTPVSKDSRGHCIIHNDVVSSTAPVKSKKPNPFGLYDMIGNVWEWTSSVPAIGSGILQKYYIRGGGWSSYWHHIYNSNRKEEIEDNRFQNLGFRCVMDLE